MMPSVWISPSDIEGKPFWLVELLDGRQVLLGTGYGARVGWRLVVNDGIVDRGGRARYIRVGLSLHQLPSIACITVEAGMRWTYNGLIGG